MKENILTYNLKIWLQFNQQIKPQNPKPQNKSMIKMMNQINYKEKFDYFQYFSLILFYLLQVILIGCQSLLSNYLDFEG